MATSAGEQLAWHVATLSELREHDRFERVHTVWTELRARSVADLVERCERLERRSVRAQRQHRIERVREVDDPGAARGTRIVPAPPP
jgi:hypothetical protein